MYTINILTKQEQTHVFQTHDLENFLKHLREQNILWDDKGQGTYIPLSEVAQIRFLNDFSEINTIQATSIPPTQQDCLQDPLECVKDRLDYSISPVEFIDDSLEENLNEDFLKEQCKHQQHHIEG